VLAGLMRAMVTTAASHVDEPAPDLRADLARAAAWRAAREGMTGHLLDLADGQPRPAWDLVERLVQWVAPALAEAGDAARVTAGLAEIRRRGTGAERQRQAYADTGSFEQVLDEVVAQTAELDGSGASG
jgi:carboxylate-amine ligase